MVFDADDTRLINLLEQILVAINRKIGSSTRDRLAKLA